MIPERHDAVVVGAGVAGSLIAKFLTHAGFRVLVLEAGPATAASLEGYMGHLATFYKARTKGPESAWPPSLQAPQPNPVDQNFRTSS
jgi:choline dehydrogenase-like flavoprotein